jgi:predicted HAD superfamily Cof-like phosphohydrolase
MIQSYKALNQVNEFMAIMGQEMPDTPQVPHPKIQALRHELIREENNELSMAADAGDIVEVADALCDLLYVVNGAFTAYGFKPELVEELFDEVQNSNMSKLCRSQEEAEATVARYREQFPEVPVYFQPVGEYFTVCRQADHKVLKSINWREPNLKAILERHGVKI